MVKKIVFTIFLFSIFLTQSAYSHLPVETTLPGDTLQKIAIRNFPEVQVKYSNNLEVYIEDIKKWNLQVKNWSSIPPGVEIYVDYPYPYYISGSTYAPPLERVTLPIEYNDQISKFLLTYLFVLKVKNEIKSTDIERSKLKYPFNIELGYFKLIKNYYFYNFNLNLNQFYKTNISGNEITNKELSPQIEYGFTLSIHKWINNNSFAYFVGTDVQFEKKSEIENTETNVNYNLANKTKTSICLGLKQFHYFKSVITYYSPTIKILEGFSISNYSLDLKLGISPLYSNIAIESLFKYGKSKDEIITRTQTYGLGIKIIF